MQKLLTTLTVFLMSTMLFATGQDQNKHERYGTVAQAYPPVQEYINPSYTLNSRSTDVTITCDGGSWQSEVSWEIVDANGDTVASGGAPFSGAASLDDGTYTVYAHDSYGDGWNGNYLTVVGSSNGVEYLNYTLPSGNEGSTTFDVGGGVPGCMTTTACNYDENATEDDGSCCETNCTDIVVGGGSWQSEVSWEIVDANGDTVATGGAPYDEFQCFDDGSYMVYGYDSYGDGWNGNTLVITDSDGNVVLFFTLDTGDYAEASFTLPLPQDLTDVFFSEYAEGSSNNKYLEIYNGTDETINLDNFIILGNYNGNPWSETFTFATGATVESGDVYVIANASASDAIQALADEVHAYGDPWYIVSFNGDDVRALCEVSGTDTTILDQIGAYDLVDPGSGWDVAGVSDGTKDYTLVRKDEVEEGNGGDWAASAGTSEEDSEWHVEERPTADYTPPTLGWHLDEPCDGHDLAFHMYDSYGDSWNGNTYEFVDADGDTVASGGLTNENCSDCGTATYTCNCGVDDLCMADGSYTLTVGGGSYTSEVSWHIIDAAGDTLYSGGAPYADVVSFGETNDVPGCTDPDAINYDETATVDDGSCYYYGDSCNIALDAVVGGDGNEATGADQWWSYTATVDGTLMATTCYDGQTEDTNLEVYLECGGDLYLDNDDAYCGDETGGNEYASELEFPCSAGQTYYFFWDDYWSPGAFVWYLYEEATPTGPTNLVAEAGMEEVMLTWEPAPSTDAITGATDLRYALTTEAFLEKREQAKANYEAPEVNGHTLEELQERYGSVRDASVYFVLYDTYGDGYGGNGYITDSNGDVAFTAPGGDWDYEVAYGPIYLGTDDYTVSFDDASWADETTWEVLQAATGDVIANGAVLDGPTTFNIADGGDVSLADLTVDIEYVEAENALYYHLINSGDVATGFFNLDVYLGAANAECGNEDAAFSVGIDALAAGDTASLYLADPAYYYGGYGTFDAGAFADVNCVVDETDESNNAVTESITLTDPTAGLTWNIYRQTGEEGYTMIATASDDPEHLDTTVMGDVEYCYYVTEILEDDSESDESNVACATPDGLGADLCPPQNLMAEAGISEVHLSWDEPWADGEATNSLNNPNIASTDEMNRGRERLPDSEVRPTLRDCWNYNEAWAYLWYGNVGEGRASIFEFDAGEWFLDSVTIYDYSNAWIGLTEAQADVIVSHVDENGNTIEGGEITSATLTTDGSFGVLDLGGVSFVMEEAGLVKVSVVSLTLVDGNGDGVEEQYAPFLLSDNGTTPSGMTGTDSTGVFTSGVYNWDLELCASMGADFSCGTFSHYSVYDGSGNMVDTTSYPDYLVTGLDNGVEHCFTVTASYAEGDSEASNEACATPSATDAEICPPENLVAEGGDSEAYLMWDAPTPSGEATNMLVNPTISTGADATLGQERLPFAVERPTLRDCWNYNEAWAYLWYGNVGEGRASIFWFEEGEWLLESVAIYDYSNAWIGLTEAQADVIVSHVDENGNTIEGGEITSATLTTDGTYGELVFDDTFFNMEEAGFVKVSVVSLTLVDGNSDGVEEEYAPFLLSDNGTTPSGMTGTDVDGVFTGGDYNWDLELCALSEEDIACGMFMYYNVYGPDGLIDTTTAEGYLVEGLTNGTEYCFEVTAQYEEGESVPSNTACVTPEVPPGLTCADAEMAVAGTNTAPQQPYWAYYDATVDGYITVSSEGAGLDTRLYAYSGADCDNLTVVADDDDGLGYPPGESIVTFASTAGTRYYIEWRDDYSEGGFDWTLEESLPPTGPENLMAYAGDGSVSLMWDPIPAGAFVNSTSIFELQALARNKEAKKAANQLPEMESHTMEELQERYGTSFRDASYYFTLYDTYGDGYWGDGFITDSNGDVVFTAPGGDWGFEASYGPILLGTGEYTVSFNEDSWMEETTWGIYEAATGDSVTGGTVFDPVTFTVADGGDVSVAELSVDIEYVEAAEVLYFHVTNSGDVAAANFWVQMDTTALAGDCDNAEETWWAVEMASLEAGATESIYLPDAAFYLGYGTRELSAFVDATCLVDETDETNNVVTETVDITDPYDGVAWNIYRSDAGADFAMVGSVDTDPMYMDAGLTNNTEYCYYVTQVLEDDTESDTSNHACATPISIPTPTDLEAEVDGWNVHLSWTDPDIGGGGGEVEDFEGAAIPDGWGMTTNAADCYGWEGWIITTDGTSAYWDVPAGDGYYAVSNDDQCNQDGSVDYLWMPEADFSGGAAALTFRSFFTGAYSQTAHILVSLDGGASFDEVAVLDGNTDWVDEYVDLDAYNGESSVQIVFWSNDNGTWASGWAVDNVSLSSPQNFFLDHYNVYRGPEGSEELIAETDMEEYMDFVMLEGNYTYSVTAVYDEYGESGPTNYVEVEVTGPEPQCNPPRNLMAESNSNDVTLTWEAPEGGPGWNLYHGVSEYATSIGTNGEADFIVAARFGPEHLADYNGMALTKVQFVPNEPTASYQIMVWTADVDGEPTLIDTTDFMSAADMTMQDYNVVELAEGIEIDWTSELWFGYRVVTPAGFPAGATAGPALQWYGDLMFWGGEWLSMAESFGLDYNWAVQGFVDFGGGGRSVESMSAIDLTNVRRKVPVNEGIFGHGNVYPPRDIVNTSRVMTNYIVYRDGGALDTTDAATVSYGDMDVDWGVHEYYVTALYDDEGCNESEPSNAVEVDLFNNPPGSFILIEPEDNTTLVVTENNMGDMLPFIWTTSTDPDNDAVHYVIAAMDSAGVYYDTTSEDAGLFLTNEDVAMGQLEDSISVMTYVWDIWAHDPWDSTSSDNGPRSLTIDVSAILALDGIGLPEVFALHNNYPNPFNPVTNISYDIPEVAQVTLEIFNIAGQKVRTLAQGQHEPGRYRIQWNATNDFGKTLSSGMYIYRIQAGDFISVKKLILMK